MGNNLGCIPPDTAIGNRCYKPCKPGYVEEGMMCNPPKPYKRTKVRESANCNADEDLIRKYANVRYIRLEFRDKAPHTLNINEIQAFQNGVNVAMGKPATLGKQYGAVTTFGPQFLTDNIVKSAVNGQMKLPHTENTIDSFMQVDLRTDTPIERVVVVNRDDCCQDRIRGAWVVCKNAAGKIVKEMQITDTKASYEMMFGESRCAVKCHPSFTQKGLWCEPVAKDGNQYTRASYDPRKLNAANYVIHSDANVDLPGNPVKGTLAECIHKCDANAGCVGFSRKKKAAFDAVDECYLKKNLKIGRKVLDDPTWQTWEYDIPADSKVIPETIIPKPKPLPMPIYSDPQLEGSPSMQLGKFGLNPWGNASKFIDPEAQWIWNTATAATSADTIPVIFRHFWKNLTREPMDATLHIIVDDKAEVRLNGNVVGTAGAGWADNKYGKIAMRLSPGVSILEIVATNTGGPAGLLASLVRNKDNIVLLRTNATWKSGRVTATPKPVIAQPVLVPAHPDAIIGVGSTDNFLYTKAAFNTPWVKVPNSGLVTSIDTLPNGGFVGIGTDGTVWTKSNLTAPWVQTNAVNKMREVRALRDGTFLGVGIDRNLYTSPTINATIWKHVGANSCCAVSVDQLPDGRFICVGTDNKLYLRANLTANWVQAPVHNCCVTQIKVRADGSILGVDMNKTVHLKKDINSPWVHVFKDGLIKSVTTAAPVFKPIMGMSAPALNTSTNLAQAESGASATLPVVTGSPAGGVPKPSDAFGSTGGKQCTELKGYRLPGGGHKVGTHALDAIEPGYGAQTDEHACSAACKSDPNCKQYVYFQAGKACYRMKNSHNYNDSDRVAGFNSGVCISSPKQCTELKGYRLPGGGHKVGTHALDAIEPGYGAQTDEHACSAACKSDPNCKQYVYFQAGKACYRMKNSHNYNDSDRVAGFNSGVCISSTDPVSQATGWNQESSSTIFLDRHNVACPPKTAMSQFRLERDGKGQFRQAYSCVPQSDLGAPQGKNTGVQDWGGGNSAFLDRHDVSCAPGTVMNQWKLGRPNGNAITIDYQCSPLPGVGNCENLSTPANDEGGGNTIYHDRHDIRCPTSKMLTRWKVVRVGGGKFKYDYTCCGKSSTTQAQNPSPPAVATSTPSAAL